MNADTVGILRGAGPDVRSRRPPDADHILSLGPYDASPHMQKGYNDRLKIEQCEFSEFTALKLVGAGVIG